MYVFLPGSVYSCYLKALPALENSDKNWTVVDVRRVEKAQENYFPGVINL